MAPGNANAHFNVSFGTSSAVRPAALAGWKRVFDRSLPQPFHIGSDAGLVIAALTIDGAQAPTVGSALAAVVAPEVSGMTTGGGVGAGGEAAAPERNVATACFSAADSPWPFAAITPPGSRDAMICWTDRARRFSRDGERDASGAS